MVKKKKGGNGLAYALIIVGVLVFVFGVSYSPFSVVAPFSLTALPGDTIFISGTVSIDGVIREGLSGELDIHPFDLYLYPNTASKYSRISLNSGCLDYGHSVIDWSWTYLVPSASYIAEHWSSDGTYYYQKVFSGFGVAPCNSEHVADYAYVRYTRIQVDADQIASPPPVPAQPATVYLTAYLDGVEHGTSKVTMNIGGNSYPVKGDSNGYANLPSAVTIAAGHLPCSVTFYAETGSGVEQPTYGGSATINAMPGEVYSVDIDMEIITPAVPTMTQGAATPVVTPTVTGTVITTLDQYKPLTPTIPPTVTVGADSEGVVPEYMPLVLSIGLISGGILWLIYRRMKQRR